MAETVRQDHEPLRNDINGWFFKETGLDELLAGATPLRIIEDLAIEE